MDSRTGKKIRWGRLVNPASQKAIIVAYSHASFLGPIPGMRTREELIHNARALHAADAVMVSPGLLPLLDEVFIGKEAPALVVQVDWQSFSRKILPYTEGAAAAMTTIPQAAAAGAVAVMSYLYLGFEDPHLEKEEIERNARWVRECEQYGLLLMIEPRSAREKMVPSDRVDPEVMSTYARICAEIGADLVKVIDPGNNESLAQIVEGCPAPVLLAGGVQKESFQESLDRAHAAVLAGCAGVVYGRNLFQSPDPTAALSALREIVHGKTLAE
jgi:fructose-bisphosphate aldolase, class I